MPSVIIANGVPAFFVVTKPRMTAKKAPARPPTSGISADGNGQGPVADADQRVDRDEGGQAGVHRVTEAQHAALAEQHVVREAGDDRDADLREHRDAAGARAQHQRRDQQHQREAAPDDEAAGVDAAARGGGDGGCGGGVVSIVSPPACRAGPWAGRSGSAPGTGTAGSARPARSSASAASSRPRRTTARCRPRARR